MWPNQFAATFSCGVVSAICHGQAALVDLQRSGQYLISGKKVTAFSHESERARGLDKVVLFSLQHALEARGAAYSCTSGTASALTGNVDRVGGGGAGTGWMRGTSDGFGGVVAELVKIRRLTDQGQQLQRIVRRGSTNTVRYRRAIMLLASAGGNRGGARRSAHNRQMRHKCAFYAFGSQSASCSIGSVSPVVSRPSSGTRS